MGAGMMFGRRSIENFHVTEPEDLATNRNSSTESAENFRIHDIHPFHHHAMTGSLIDLLFGGVRFAPFPTSCLSVFWPPISPFLRSARVPGLI